MKTIKAEVIAVLVAFVGMTVLWSILYLCDNHDFDLIFMLVSTLLGAYSGLLIRWHKKSN